MNGAFLGSAITVTQRVQSLIYWLNCSQEEQHQQSVISKTYHKDIIFDNSLWLYSPKSRKEFLSRLGLYPSYLNGTALPFRNSSRLPGGPGGLHDLDAAWRGSVWAAF